MPRRVDGSTIEHLLSSDDIRGLRVHMIGIGGCGMSGAAAMLLRFGAEVSGSDQATFDALPELVAAGARVFLGHRAEQVHPATDLVVMSAAISETNPELAAARYRSVQVIKYAQLLGCLMKWFEGVAVSGTHGKTTTTALCAHVFREAGLAPSFVVGPLPPGLLGIGIRDVWADAGHQLTC